MSAIAANNRFLHAAIQGDLPALEQALKDGADPCATDRNGSIFRQYRGIEQSTPKRNALHLALAQGHDAVVEHLTQKLPERTVSQLVNAEDAMQRTPVFDLVKCSSISERSFQCLAAAGARFDHADGIDSTPLHFLSENKEKLPFLKKAIDVLSPLRESMKPIRQLIGSFWPHKLAGIIASYLYLSAEGILNTVGTWDAPIHDAISRYNWEGVRLLLEAGTDPDIKNRGKLTLQECVDNQKIRLSEELEYRKIMLTDVNMQPPSSHRELADASTECLCATLDEANRLVLPKTEAIEATD